MKAARDAEADGPERTCILTRTKGTPETLIRFVLGPDASVVPDIRAKLPGRGAWVTAEAAAVKEAVRRKSFARAFKAQILVPPDLVETVDALLERDALQALSLANKAGLVVAGATKVEKAATRALAAVVHAADASPDGRRKVDAAIKRQLGEAGDGIPRIDLFRSDQLDLALGRTNVIHAALATGSATYGFVSRSLRLDRFRRGRPPADAAGPERCIEE